MKVYEEEVRRRYSVPGMPSYTKRSVNALHIHPQNNVIHERAKFDLAYKLASEGKKFISECVSRDGRRIDLVCLSDGQEYEVVYKHESDVEVRNHRLRGVVVVFAGETIVCSVCGLVYPKRNSKGICQLCSKR